MADKKEVSSLNFKPSEELPKITELLSYVFIDFLKLDFLYFKYSQVPCISKYIPQDDRNRKKAANDAKKAAKEANKVRMQQRNLRAKEGKLPL